MGSLFYGGNRLRIEIDDPVLQALEIVTIAKIRRREPFLLTWRDSTSVGSGRSSVVVNPHIELHFKYLGSRVPNVDRELVETLAQMSNSNGGVRLDSATLATPAVGGRNTQGVAS